VPSNGSEWRLNVWQGFFPSSDAALDGFGGLAPADAFAPNAAGLYNMLGNVWEWTSTYLAKSSRQRVLRGGSYLDSASGEWNHKVSTSTRMGNTEDSSADNMGFRCVKSARSSVQGRKPQGCVMASDGLGWPPRMASDGLGWPRMDSDGLGWPRMASDGLGWPRMASDCRRLRAAESAA